MCMSICSNTGHVERIIIVMGRVHGARERAHTRNARPGQSNEENQAEMEMKRCANLSLALNYIVRRRLETARMKGMPE